MKNKYFGDVGDFGKYGMLSSLAGNNLNIGVNWYLTKDDNKPDGNHLGYLDKSEFRSCDNNLHDFLNQCISQNRREVSALKELQRFSDVTYYDSILDIESIKGLSEKGRIKRKTIRNEWFQESLKELQNCDVIFCDPDNGIETKSLSKTSKDSVKYVYKDEILEMVGKGHSVITYNHRDRSKESEYKARFTETHEIVEEKTSLRVIRFNRYSVRDYLFFIQKEHEEIINSQLDQFLRDFNWRRMFTELDME